MESIETSLISIISTDHGRLRREQRDISKRDIKKAIKHGSRERAWGQRWKIEHDGIIFIATNDLSEEVTVYPSPLELAPLDHQALEDHRKARLVLDQKPELCVSHTVLVVDNSGSMLKHDINLHRDRQVAAYSVTALEFVAEQLLTKISNNSDVVSLVEFDGSARTVFRREPMSWVLYNKLLSRRNRRDYMSRQSEAQHDMRFADSNYIPALKLAHELLHMGDHERCALSVMFLSDGAPSDARDLGLTPAAAERRIVSLGAQTAKDFGERLDFKLIGFGKADKDFSVLKAMASGIAACKSGTRVDFIYCDKFANAMGTAVSSLVSSLQTSKTSLAERARDSQSVRSDIDVDETNGGSTSEWKYSPILNHFAYSPKCNMFIPHAGLPPGAINASNSSEAKTREMLPPGYLATRTQACGAGAERVAFRCRLSDEESARGHVFHEMVAKETLLADRIEENLDFHLTFCKTQHLASLLATEFNQRLEALERFAKPTTPRLEFLECSILKLYDPVSPNEARGVLVEEWLDTENLEWCKWNDNGGRVRGLALHPPIDVDYELEKLQQANNAKLDVVVEGDSDEEYGSDVEDLLGAEELMDEDPLVNFGEPDNTNYTPEATPAHYLQAFTHFTYRFTNRKAMVCDLQGVYDDRATPPTFLLTDPAIHYRSHRRREVFGRTDKGAYGVKRFFATHRCSGVCKALRLTRHNFNWKRDWENRSAELNQIMRNLASPNKVHSAGH